MSNSIIAVIAGASYSAAYIAPRPYCFVALTVSTLGVILMRSLS